VSSSSTFPYSAAELDEFRRVQRLAYDIALEVESQLQAGMTETEVCTLLAAAQAEREVVQVFHQPFAWFGTRTMLGSDWAPETANAHELASTGVRPSTAFFPTGDTLVDGMPLILDLAPVVHGISSDIGYSTVIGHNATFDELDRGLAHIRTFVLEGIRAKDSMCNIYRELDLLLAQRGWENCHRHYPDRALGHIVVPLDHEPSRVSPIPGFGTAAAEALLAAGLSALENGTCYPVWNDSTFTDYPACPGLWAVEPHIGRNGVGVKFEELLVVTDDDAYWLDDHLPHTVRWAAAGYSTASFWRE